MNRRNFASLAALAPFAASASDLNSTQATKPMVVLPERAKVYNMGQGEARILVSAEQSSGAWWVGSFHSDPGRAKCAGHSRPSFFFSLWELLPASFARVS